jgi:hypothetical protein
MAYNKKYPKIQRTNGPYPRNRYGVRYDSITKQQRRLLLEHPIIAERAQSDQFLHIIFEVCRHRHVDRFDKFYYDWSTDSFMKIEELKESYDLIEWECAISGRPIQSNISDFSPKNFIHEDYFDILDGPMIDGRIVESSVRFQKHVKKLLLNQQKEFLKYARKNSKL